MRYPHLMTRDRLLLLLIPLAALLAIFPLLLHGATCGHDLSFHLLSWQEAARQFAGGNLHPRWAFTPAYGAGEPRFVFYPPLSWTVGGLLTLAVSAVAAHAHLGPAHAFAAVPTLYLWFALTAAGLAMARLARRFVAAPLALLAATLYIANPYTLFTAFERSAFAELLAAALLPLLLAALLPGPAESAETPGIPALALPLALLWLTNAPAAVIGSYTVLFIVLLRLLPAVRNPAARPPALAFAGRAIAASLLAFALAAFYLVPVLFERRWVQIAMAILPGLRPDDNTLFHHTSDAFHDAVLHTASLLALGLLAVSLLACLLAAMADRRSQAPSLLTPLPLLATLTVVIAFLLTPLSLPLWHHLPQFAFLQFPWRLLALLAPVAVLALTLSLRRLALSRLSLAILSFALPAVLSTFAFHGFHQACDLEDTPQARFAVFHSPTGDEPTDEYTPALADNDSLKDNNPSFRLLPAGSNDDTPPPAAAHPGPAPLSLSLDLSEPELLILNLRNYPTWRITVNGRLDTDRDLRADGLLTLPLPSGRQQIVLSQHTPGAEYIADGLSVSAVFLAATLILRRRRHTAA